MNDTGRLWSLCSHKWVQKKEIKQYKEQSVAIIVNYYKQLHNMNKFGRLCPEELMLKHKGDALCAITPIKEKRSEKIK